MKTFCSSWWMPLRVDLRCATLMLRLMFCGRISNFSHIQATLYDTNCNYWLSTEKQKSARHLLLAFCLTVDESNTTVSHHRDDELTNSRSRFSFRNLLASMCLDDFTVLVAPGGGCLSHALLHVKEHDVDSFARMNKSSTRTRLQHVSGTRSGLHS